MVLILPVSFQRIPLLYSGGRTLWSQSSIQTQQASEIIFTFLNLK